MSCSEKRKGASEATPAIKKQKKLHNSTLKEDGVPIDTVIKVSGLSGEEIEIL
ncbi:MAG: hypothetical protein GY765_14935 [bacterium]|nr:hypothetical protein [bacterium]